MAPPQTQLTAIPGGAAGGEEEAQPRTIPHSIEAEQQLLGAILANNQIHGQIEELVAAEHFYDPVHGRIFETAAKRIRDGSRADPVVLKPYFEEDAGLAELGGQAYLVNLMRGAVSMFAAREYAATIHDMAMRRQLIELGLDISDRAARHDVDSTAQDQAVDAEKKLFEIAESRQSQSVFKSFLQAATEATKAANDAFRRDGELAGLSTGLAELDSGVGGLQNSDLLIIAGRPAMGKTSLATNIAFHVASGWKPGGSTGAKPEGRPEGAVGFFSLEMSAEQLATRILSAATEIPSQKILRGAISADQLRKFIEAVHSLEDSPLFIDDTPALQISHLWARARRLKRQKDLKLLVVDYLQLIRPDRASDSRVNEISSITQALKAIAKELDIPVIALSQLSRQVESREDKRPQLSDLRESGSIEQDADVVMFVYRDEYYEELRKPPEENVEEVQQWQDRMHERHGKGEVIIRKHRHGPTGTVRLHFNGEVTLFSDPARGEDRSGPGGGPRADHDDF